MSADPVATGPMASGRTPEEVRRALAGRIGSGHLHPGQRLGAERALAAELGVSRATIYKHVPEVTTGRAAAHPPQPRTPEPGLNRLGVACASEGPSECRP